MKFIAGETYLIDKGFNDCEVKLLRISNKTSGYVKLPNGKEIYVTLKRLSLIKQ